MKISPYYLFWIVLSCLSIALTLVNVGLVMNDVVLDDNNLLVESEVTDWRIYERSGIRSTLSVTSYELQYKFSLPNDPIEYTYAEAATGRKNLWASLPIEAWHEAKKTKVVLVQYSTEDPWNNKIYGTSSVTDNLAGLVMSILIMLSVLWFTLGVKRNYRKKIDLI